MPLTKPRATASPDFAGVPAGPAEKAGSLGFSAGHLGCVGERFETTARVAGTTPAQPGDAEDVLRRCLRTVDTGLALCCPLPIGSDVRIGSVVHVRGVVTGHRVQGHNDVTEISVDTIERVG